MGKRKALGGLAGFLGSLKQDESSTQPETASVEPKNEKFLPKEDTTVVADPKAKPRPLKKRKVGLLGPSWEKYDATGLATHYTHINQVPDKLRKYFAQRHRYFSLYSEGCLLDEVGWYSVTPELIADQIAERCRCDTVLDAFCGVGGNTIALAKTCERVIAMDTSPVRLALARHNAALYEVADRIEFILGDYISFAKSYLNSSNPSQARKIDVIFLSPPWGGPEYLEGSPSSTVDETVSDKQQEHPEYSLASVQPIHGAELFQLSRRITPNIAYYLPRNANVEEISELLTQEHSGENSSVEKRKEKVQQGREGKDALEKVEIEEEWMGPKLKALTCYFGGLVRGQEHLFE